MLMLKRFQLADLNRWQSQEAKHDKEGKKRSGKGLPKLALGLACGHFCPPKEKARRKQNIP